MSYIIILAPAREHIELGILRYIYKNNTELLSQDHTFTINGIRALLVVFTALISLITPYFGTVLGAVGGLTDAFQSFVLPPLIFLKIETNHSITQRIFYMMIFFWGTGTIAFTVINIFRTIDSII